MFVSALYDFRKNLSVRGKGDHSWSQIDGFPFFLRPKGFQMLQSFEYGKNKKMRNSIKLSQEQLPCVGEERERCMVGDKLRVTKKKSVDDNEN